MEKRNPRGRLENVEFGGMLARTRTTYNQGFYLMDIADDIPALCRHIQIRCDWPAENAANEILSMTIMGGIAAEK